MAAKQKNNSTPVQAQQAGAQQSETLEITITLEELTFGDIELLDKADRQELSLTDTVKLLDRLVVGGVKHIKLSRMHEVMAAVQAAIKRVGNPESSLGN